MSVYGRKELVELNNGNGWLTAQIIWIRPHHKLPVWFLHSIEPVEGLWR